jgi:hypothetical protein
MGSQMLVFSEDPLNSSSSVHDHLPLATATGGELLLHGLSPGTFARTEESLVVVVVGGGGAVVVVGGDVVLVVGSGGDVVVAVAGDAQRLSNCSSALHSVAVVVVRSADCFAAASWRAGRSGCPDAGPMTATRTAVRTARAATVAPATARDRRRGSPLVGPNALSPGVVRAEDARLLPLGNRAIPGTL